MDLGSNRYYDDETLVHYVQFHVHYAFQKPVPENAKGKRCIVNDLISFVYLILSSVSTPDTISASQPTDPTHPKHTYRQTFRPLQLHSVTVVGEKT